MTTQEVKGEDYIVQFDPDSVSVYFQGELSLAGATEYAPITNLLNEVAESEPHTMTIDLRNLALSIVRELVCCLNLFSVCEKQRSSGSRFGSNHMPWQGKSLKNLEKLLPGLKLEIE